jgi:hypothetical protein
MGRWGDGEMGGWGDGENKLLPITNYQLPITNYQLPMPHAPFPIPYIFVATICENVKSGTLCFPQKNYRIRRLCLRGLLANISAYSLNLIN